MTQETTTPAAQSPAATPVRDFFDRWRPKVAYQSLSLGLICGLVALLLLVGNAVTKSTIDAQLVEDQLAVLRQVLPASLYDNNPLQDKVTLQDAELGPIEVYPARKDGVLTGMALSISNIGYGGPIQQMVGLDSDGRILGVRVLAHKETPGLADKIEVAKSDWITRFDGLSLENTALGQWRVKKDGGQFDQFAGATITPRAVVKSVLQALQFQQRHQAGLATTKEVQP